MSTLFAWFFILAPVALYMIFMWHYTKGDR